MPDIQIIITLSTETGDLKVEGAIQNSTMAYGMLESAKVAIQDMVRQQENRVQPAPAGLLIPRN